MKIKRSLLSISLAALSAAAFAGSAGIPQSTFTGFFAGINLGARIVQLDIKQDKTGGNNYNYDVNTSHTQPTQGVDFGYGYQLANNLYLAGMLRANIAQGEYKVSDTYQTGVAYTNKTTVNQTYGVIGELGYALTSRFLPYLSLGWQWMHVDTSMTDSSNGANFGFDHYANGPTAGLGFHYKVTQHVLIGAEYNMAFYGTRRSTRTISSNAYVTKVQPSAVMTGLLTVDYLF